MAYEFMHLRPGDSPTRIWQPQDTAREKEAIARAADVRFGLDRMLSGDAGLRIAAIDSQRLIAAGHSYGANTTLLAVGAQVVRGGETINCHDARGKAQQMRRRCLGRG